MSETSTHGFSTPLLASDFPAHVFLTGTGTGVGKTVTAAVLCRLREAEYWKPVQSGSAEDDSLAILGLARATAVHLPAVQLREPASPHLSAEREGVRLSVAEIASEKPEAYFLVVEGAGGALVPLNETETMADLAKALELPVVVAASSGLGTINHTVLTVEALRARGLTVAGVVLKGPAHGSNARAIRDLGRVPVLLRIPELFPLDAEAIDRFCQEVRDGKVADPCEEETPVALLAPVGDLVARDKAVIWHPDTQHATAPEPFAVTGVQGALIHTKDGEVIDAVSSWWVTGHGHAHPYVARAIAEQARELEQVIFADCTHEPAVRLAERLLPLLPGHPSRLFFSDNGSTAIEVAIKALVQKARQAGVERPRVAAFAGAYHGDTFGAMSTGERSAFTAPFDPFLFEVDRLPTPAGAWDPSSSEALAKSAQALEAFGTWARAHRGEIACVLIEPRVQGSDGMRMYPRSFLEGMDRICQEEGIGWIADEVFTGFGRTGSLFACDGEPTLHPAAICLSKGLTAGFLPMGATAFREDIFQAFLSPDLAHAFLHGHSYTANPLGCAAALAGLDLCADPDYLPRIARLEKGHQMRLAELSRHHALSGVRTMGGLAAFEIPGAAGGYLARGGQAVALACRKRNVLIRPLGDTIYLMLPFCVRSSELDRVYEALDAALRECCSAA